MIQRRKDPSSWMTRYWRRIRALAKAEDCPIHRARFLYKEYKRSGLIS